MHTTTACLGITNCLMTMFECLPLILLLVGCAHILYITIRQLVVVCLLC